MNAFRMTPDGSLDREYLRICAIFRLLKHQRITFEQALEIADRPIKGCYRRPGWLANTIAIWKAGPINWHGLIGLTAA
jgi:hypothetical protein